MHTVHVAGPVFRSGDFAASAELGRLYDHLESTAKHADVRVQLPIYDKQLDDLPTYEFARAIWKRIREADSLLALIDAPGGNPGSNLSVAGEAHWAAEAGKRVAIVALEPDRVPRLMRALSNFEVYPAKGVDFVAVFRDLRG